jgi:hypothetical protein
MSMMMMFSYDIWWYFRSDTVKEPRPASRFTVSERQKCALLITYAILFQYDVTIKYEFP